MRQTSPKSVTPHSRNSQLVPGERTGTTNQRLMAVLGVKGLERE